MEEIIRAAIIAVTISQLGALAALPIIVWITKK